MLFSFSSYLSLRCSINSLAILRVSFPLSSSGFSDEETFFLTGGVVTNGEVDSDLEFTLVSS